MIWLAAYIWIAIFTWTCPLWPIANFEGWDSWYARISESGEDFEAPVQLVARSFITLLWPLHAVILLVEVTKAK